MVNIIIVDDSQSKIDAILLGLPVGIRNNIDIAMSKSAAQEAFSKKTYDLAFIDLALPRHAGSTPESYEGIDLIKEINQFDWFKTPKKILAITQHSDLESTFSHNLKELGVTLHYDDGTGNIADIVKYQYETITKASQQLEFNYDVLIIVALDEEAAHILNDKRFSWSRANYLGIDDINLRISTLNIAGYERKLGLIILPRMGLVSSAITTSRAVNQLKPRYVMMPGICAGIEGAVNIGDIIVANPSWEWQTGKWNGNCFAIEPYQISVDQKMIGKFEELIETNILDKLWGATLNIRPTKSPACHIGPMVSGSSVISNAQKVNELKTQHRKLIGIEMEIFGVYAACAQSSVPPDFIGFKAVCDFGNESKGDNFHPFCSEISAKLCAEFVEFLLCNTP